jgi:amidase
VQDNINYEGIHSTLGYVSFLKHPPASKNSAVVDILLKLGAVLYVKTNVPQTLIVSFLSFNTGDHLRLSNRNIL